MYKFACMNDKPQAASVKNVKADMLITRNAFGVNLNVPYSVAKTHGALNANVPYRLEECRLMLIASGNISFFINLQPVSLTGGECLFVRQGCIGEIVSVSEDTVFSILSFDETLLGDHLLSFGYVMKRELPVPEFQDVQTALTLIRSISSKEPFRAEAVYMQILSLMMNLKAMDTANREERVEAKGKRAQELFGRFLELVKENAVEQHHSPFYAQELCVTPQYLNRIVNRVSGEPVSHWIDKALLSEAKIRLKHNRHETIAQIAYSMGFSNPTLFGVFFKRMTGQTPGNYRRTDTD